MARKFKQLTHDDRLAIEALVKAGHSKREIADIVEVHISTIYRELKRGRCTTKTTDLIMVEVYSPEIAEQRYQNHLREKGPGLKIGNDRKLADYIERKILKEDYSPGAVLGEIKAQGLKFKTTISKATLYSYIDKGIFLSLTNKRLPVKGNREKKYKKVRKKRARVAAGTSIEKRPEHIKERKEFGHWEMDTVLGKKGKSKNCLLVLTERKTRMEIIMKLHRNTMAAVVKALDFLERKWGGLFRKIFKTITVDNGSEFADCEGLEQSILGEGKRTNLYYCHPYCSFERGSNEVANRLIRRKIPKGTNFDNRSEAEIKEVEDWINHYPREIFTYKTAHQMFELELAKVA